MTEHGFDGALEFTDVASGLEVPPALQASLDRHRAHLATLVKTLQAAGLPKPQIAASVNVLIASYRSELINALNAMMKAEHDEY